MRATRLGVCVMVAVLCSVMVGCASFTVGTDGNPPRIKSQGVLNSYMACNGFRPYDGKIIEIGVISDNDRWGDLVSVDVWPVGGVGVSFIGMKLKVLPFEIGLGVLGNNPKPESYGCKVKSAAKDGKKPCGHKKKEPTPEKK